MKKTFLISDESLNSYGFRVLTNGISLERFEKNPIMLWNHTRSYGDNNDTLLPIGKWTNIRKEDDKLFADAEFDMDDAFAAKIAKKVEKGYINACSISIIALEESGDIDNVVQGQTRNTIIKSILREVSLVDIPSNSNAVSLYDINGEQIDLSARPQNIIKQNNKMKLIAMKLGLADNASEQDLVSAIEKRDTQIVELEKQLKELSEAQEKMTKKNIDDLVNAAVVGKKITADKKQHFTELGAKIGVDALKTTLDAMSASVKLTDMINSRSADKTAAVKFGEMNEAQLKDLRENDKETYASLYESEFGFKPILN